MEPRPIVIGPAFCPLPALLDSRSFVGQRLTGSRMAGSLKQYWHDPQRYVSANGWWRRLKDLQEGQQAFTLSSTSVYPRTVH